MSTPLQLRGRVAALSRSRSADDPDLLTSKQQLASANIERYIERVVAEAPPLTDEQCDRLVAILRGASA